MLPLLEEKCRAIKLRFLKMYALANAGHVGSSLSCAEILTFIRFGWMKPGDDFILSKGHAAAALYSLLAETGDLSQDDIQTFYQDGTFLAGHPPPDRLPGIPFATGSLGHGLSLCAGLSLANQLRGGEGTVFCVTSDGELNEGSIWEAALFAAHHQLHNLRWIIDRNRIQGFGRTEDVLGLEPLADKLRAFGWAVFETNGHDFNSLSETKKRAEDSHAKHPVAVICHTTKGRGLAQLEDTVDCHYLPLKPENFNQIVETLLHSSKKNA